MLPRFDGAPPGLVTRRGLAAETGYSERSIATVLGRHPEWPGPVGQMRVGRVWVLLYDLEVMLQVMPSAAGSVRRGGPATISDDDGVLTCLECGRRYRALGRHLQAAHEISPQEYRRRWRLPSTGALMADGLRVEQAVRQRGVDTGHLLPYQQADYLESIRDAAALQATADYDMVREHRLPGRQHAARVMVQRRRDKLEAQVRAAGFASVAEGIEATRGMSAAAAARVLGVGKSTVLRRRAAGGDAERRPPPGEG